MKEKKKKTPHVSYRSWHGFMVSRVLVPTAYGSLGSGLAPGRFSTSPLWKNGRNWFWAIGAMAAADRDFQNGV
jgi:hypothetical protein